MYHLRIDVGDDDKARTMIFGYQDIGNDMYL